MHFIAVVVICTSEALSEARVGVCVKALPGPTSDQTICTIQGQLNRPRGNFERAK